MSAPAAPLDLEGLRTRVDRGEVHTVLLAIVDMQGRLQGKRLDAHYFMHDVVAHGTEGCNYLLAVDVDMNTVEGYRMSSWDKGYGDFVMQPDFSTLRLLPWQEGTAFLYADLVWEDGSDVVASPRQILKRQTARLAERDLVAMVGTELEFIVFNDTYEALWSSGYRDLHPANLYNVDYSVLGTARIEPLLRRIRLGDGGRGPAGRVGQGRVQPRAARDRVQVHRRAGHLRQPLPLQDRGQGDRRPGGHVAHVHGQVRRA